MKVTVQRSTTVVRLSVTEEDLRNSIHGYTAFQGIILYCLCIVVVTSRCHMADLQKLFYEIWQPSLRQMMTSLWACYRPGGFPT